MGGCGDAKLAQHGGHCHSQKHQPAPSHITDPTQCVPAAHLQQLRAFPQRIPRNALLPFRLRPERGGERRKQLPRPSLLHNLRPEADAQHAACGKEGRVGRNLSMWASGSGAALECAYTRGCSSI